MIQHFVAPAVAIIFAAVIVIRIRGRHMSTAVLLERSRPDLLEQLLPYARHGDNDRLLQVIGGFGGLICMYRACGAIATLVNRYAREGNKPGPLAEQAMVYAICARLLVLSAMVEHLIRRSLPMWPLVFTSALAQIYCDMACTLEAMEIHA